jgi:2,3-bisphosphoglycerate-dependent phosphoglycerate mutase
MRLLLIRHGQSENNQSHAVTGTWDFRVPDPQLTDVGREQARRLADAFAAGRLPRPDILITSLMRRAVQTAAPTADALGLPLNGDASVHEVNTPAESSSPDNVSHGGPEVPHPGASASELLALSSRLLLPGEADESGWFHRPYENTRTAWQRAQRVMARLNDEYAHTDLLLAIFTHGWFSQYLMRAIMGWPPASDGRLPVWIDLNNTGTALFEWQLGWHDYISDRVVKSCWINRTDHLTDDLLTS